VVATSCTGLDNLPSSLSQLLFVFSSGKLLSHNDTVISANMILHSGRAISLKIESFVQTLLKGSKVFQ
jgi:hypothetical protein